MLVFSVVAYSQEAAKKQSIHVDELNERPVIGKLGVPLGTVTEIKAQIVAGDELRMKEYQGIYLLKVTHVAGVKLNKPPLLRFSVSVPVRAFVGVSVASDHFGLYEMKNGKKAGSLDSEQIRELEKGYVGKTVRLVVYESGSFHGQPDKLPKDYPTPADTGFHFSTSLDVVGEKK